MSVEFTERKGGVRWGCLRGGHNNFPNVPFSRGDKEAVTSTGEDECE